MTDTALPQDTLTLVADIGGTNTRVALAEGARLLPETTRRFSNAAYPGIGPLLATYLAETGVADCAGVCVAAAGPVRDGRARMTNLDWEIDAEGLARATRAERAAVLNDLQAQGHALGRIDTDRLRPLRAGRPAGPGASMLVVGVGTGLNAAPVHFLDGRRLVPPSECGHVTLPVRTAEELDLAARVAGGAGRFAGLEEALSGRGLERIDAWAAARAGRRGDRDAAAVVAALDAGGDAVAEEAGRVFARLLGRALGDLALVHLPFGGLFLIGGVARALTPHLPRLGFEEAFGDKGRFADFVRQFPVQVVEDDTAALIGCAAFMAD
jgi:glucokinase